MIKNMHILSHHSLVAQINPNYSSIELRKKFSRRLENPRISTSSFEINAIDEDVASSFVRHGIKWRRTRMEINSCVEAWRARRWRRWRRRRRRRNVMPDIVIHDSVACSVARESAWKNLWGSAVAKDWFVRTSWVSRPPPSSPSSRNCEGERGGKYTWYLVFARRKRYYFLGR